MLESTVSSEKLKAMAPLVRREFAALCIGVFCAAALALLPVVVPLTVRYRNPPYHRFGGLDLHQWLLGTALSVFCLCVACIGLSLRPVRRGVFALCLAAAVGYLMVFLVFLGYLFASFLLPTL